jgi:mandelamide amidase
LKGTSRRRFLATAACLTPVCASTAAVRVVESLGRAGRSDVDDDLVRLDARQAVQHIRLGNLRAEVYAARLLEHYTANKALNTAISIDRERVLERAREIDVARLRNERLGPLAGLPYMVKDTINVAGYPTTAGTPALRGYIAKTHGPIVDAMERCGAIMFAKANCQEMGQGPTSSNPFFGFVRNPYDPRRIPGGSSGGNGASLAARIVPAGLGADGGGSIRIPAAFCGVVGLRPTTAGPQKRYADAGQVPPAGPNSNGTIGPMARTVADVAMLDSCIMRTPVPAVPDLRDIRIGLPRQSYFWQELERDVGDLMEEALTKLRKAGARLVDVDLHDVIDLDAQYKAMPAGAQDNLFADWLSEHVPGVTLEGLIAEIRSKDVKASREARLKARPLPGPSPEDRAELRTRLINSYHDVFRVNDIAAIAFPTIPITAPLIRPEGDVPGQTLELHGRQIPYIEVIARNTYFGSRQGAPGLSLPVGLTRSDLPVGLELDGPQGDDVALLGLGMAIENTLGSIPPPRLTYTARTTNERQPETA